MGDEIATPRRRRLAFAAAIAIVFCVRASITLTTSTATTDEPEYITAGYSYLVTHQLRLELWHPPLAFLLAGIAVRARFDLPFEPDPVAWATAEPRQIARRFLYAEANDADAIVHTARIPSLLFGLATVLLIGLWSGQLWGTRAGWFALALAACDPNLIALSTVVTPDIGVTWFVLLTMYLTWRYLERPSRGRWLALAGAALLAVATKHVGFLVGPLIVIALAERVASARADTGGPDRRAWLRTLGRALAESAGVAAIALVLAALVLGTRVFGLFLPVLHALHEQLWHLHNLPLGYLAGEVSRRGWWHYYLVVLALKVPLGTLVLLGTSIGWRSAGTPMRRAEVVLLAVPAALVVAFISWSRVDLGMRLILPALPFAIILAARAATLPGRRWRRFTAGALAATVLSSSLAVANEIGYVNELARVSGGGARWLSDSNLDWGQDLNRLARYLRETLAPPIYLAYFGGGSPTYLGLRHATLPTAVSFPPDADVVDDRSEPLAPCEADRQLIAISTFRQQGIIETYPDLYGWLSALTPIAELGTSIHVYDVTGDAESHVRLAIIFGIGSPTGACERRRAIALDPRTAARFSSTR